MARVAVNRYWQMYFGTGLVKTADDFGSQGETPSHPELLDWLATEPSSASAGTSRPCSASSSLPLLIGNPPSPVRNCASAIPKTALSRTAPAWCATGRRRIRSAIRLSLVSGLLSTRMGGASVKTYQPEGLWEQLSAFPGRKLYVRSQGEDLWRRSVYTYWKRTVPPPSLTIFDAPTREACVVRRARYEFHAALQALALLNDEKCISRLPANSPSACLPKAARRPNNNAWRGRLRAAISRPRHRRRGAHPGTGASNAGSRNTVRTSRRRRNSLAAGESPRDKSLDAAELAAYTTRRPA